MKPSRLLLTAFFLALAGCEAVNENGAEESRFALATACLPPEPGPSRVDSAAWAKRAVTTDSSGLRVLFVSADSLRFILPVTVNCGLRYAFTASLPAPDTLVIAERVIGGATARCMCRKELTVSLGAESGRSLDRVKVLKTPSGAFLDFH